MVAEAAIPSSGGQDRLEKAEETEKKKESRLLEKWQKLEYKSTQSRKAVISGRK